jgi:hypothetical protein
MHEYKITLQKLSGIMQLGKKQMCKWEMSANLWEKGEQLLLL